MQPVSEALRKTLPQNMIYAVEAVTNSVIVHDHIRPTITGQWMNCGGGGLGWSGGCAFRIKLAANAEDNYPKPADVIIVVQIVSNSSFLFSVPSSVYWVPQRCGIPVITVVLSNKSMLTPSIGHIRCIDLHPTLTRSYKQDAMPHEGQCCLYTLTDRHPTLRIQS
jgi:thiamine pyrophosphate-dependent acetolactate synthase large subunit-like protein